MQNHIIDFIDYNLVYHCNLNCTACYHFCPLVKEKQFADINILKKNLSRLNTILGKYKTRVHIKLIGGEPLLHPQLIDACNIARKCLPETQILLYTNGILLNKWLSNENFVYTIKNNCIKIVITNYNFKKLKPLYNQYFSYSKKYFTTEYLSLENDINKYYCKFGHYSKTCSSLDWNGNYHYCGLTETIHYLNEYYGYNFKVIKNLDYVNIFENIDYFTILKKRFKIRPFCGYCRNSKEILWKQFDKQNTWIQK